MIKCDYCSDKAYSIFNEELLCERHYGVLSPTKDKSHTKCPVYKTSLERKLSKKYIKLMNDYSTKEELDGILGDFLADAEVIKQKNKLYSVEEAELYA